MWSVGVICYILLSGRPPFFGKNKELIFESILTKEINFQQELWSQISDEAKQFISLTLQKEQDQRPSVQQLLDSSWIKRFIRQPIVAEQVELGIGKSLREFKNVIIFQNGVLSFIVELRGN